MSVENLGWEETTVSRIKVEENGRQAVFLNLDKSKFKKLKFDGGVVNNRVAADWIVKKVGVGKVIVELKGKDVSHAIEQVLETAQWMSDNGINGGKLAGLIVSSQYPKFSTAIQRGKKECLKRFGGPLHVVAKNCDYNFERVLEILGPV